MSIPYQVQYYEITKNLIHNPTKVGDSRIGKINSRFSEQLRVDLKKEFPLQDIKKIKPSNIIHELIWMLRGDTNIKYLVENDCHIWTDDAYRYFNEKYKDGYLQNLEKPSLFDDNLFTKEDFVKMVLEDKVIDYTHHIVKNGNYVGSTPAKYKFGNLDRVYGIQWRQFDGMTDQISNCINTLKTNPDDRRMIVTAHNPSDIERGIVGLPSCHNYFQFYTVKNEDGGRDLSTFVNIRSNDFGLGNPYNVAQYALLTHIIAKIVGMGVGELVVNSVDCHIYHIHFDGMKEWMRRFEERYENDKSMSVDQYYCNAQINFKRDYFTIDDLNGDDIEITNYEPDTYIKMKLLT